MKNRSPSAVVALSSVVTCLPFLALMLLCLPVGTAFAQEVAQGAAPAVPSFGEAISKMMPVIAVSFFIFYVMVLRPQNQKLQSQKAMITALSKGDTVVTSSGIIAKVSQIEADVVTLEIAPQVKLRVEAEHVKRRFEEPQPEVVKK